MISRDQSRVIVSRDPSRVTEAKPKFIRTDPSNCPHDDTLKKIWCTFVVGKAFQNRGVVEDSGWPPSAAFGPIRDVYPRKEAWKKTPTATEVTTAIREANGVSVLAHPGKHHPDAATAERERIEQWLDGYVDGVEIYHPANTHDYREILRSIAEPDGCVYTDGSDRHDLDAGDSDAPVRCLETLKETAGE